MVAVVTLALPCTRTLAGNNIISDQIVDGSGAPWQLPGGGNARLADLGLARVPSGSNHPVQVAPWATLPGDIAQMSHLGDDLYFGTTDGQIWRYDKQGNRDSTPLLRPAGAARNVQQRRTVFRTRLARLCLASRLCRERPALHHAS